MNSKQKKCDLKKLISAQKMFIKCLYKGQSFYPKSLKKIEMEHNFSPTNSQPSTLPEHNSILKLVIHPRSQYRLTGILKILGNGF